jgi:hypothetical protein
MTWRHRRGLLLAGAIVGVLVLAFAGIAGGQTKTKTFSSGTINQQYADFNTASHDFVLNQKGLKKTKKFKAAKVKDVNVFVRSTNTCAIAQELELANPGGQSVTLAERRNGQCGSGYGAGDTDCTGTLARFDDEGETPIEDATTAPYDGSYIPLQPLSEFDRTKVKGRWTFSITDTDGFGDTNALRCVELEIKYKRKKKH